MGKRERLKLEFLWRSSFLDKGLRLGKKLQWSLDNSPSKKSCHIGSHVVFSFVLDVQRDGEVVVVVQTLASDENPIS